MSTSHAGRDPVRDRTASASPTPDNALDDVCACGAPLDDGEGWNGLCGGCADRAENEAP